MKAMQFTFVLNIKLKLDDIEAGPLPMFYFGQALVEILLGHRNLQYLSTYNNII